MRVRSAVDGPVTALIWGVVIIGFSSVVFVPAAARLITAAVFVPVAAGVLWIYFGTYYELRQEQLYCRSGPFVERIPYARIKSVTASRNMLSSMALSSRRIEIRQHGKGYIMGTTLISPVGREEFMRELISRCPNLVG